jgi:hypothetical protein
MIISFPRLFKADPGPNPEQPNWKYSATLIATPEVLRGAQWGQVKPAILEAARLKFGEKGVASLLKGNLKQPIRDDGEDKGHPKGSLFFTARSDQKPGVVSIDPDEDGRPRKIKDTEQDIGGRYEVYSGCIVNATVAFYGYDNISKGVAVGLRNIQKVGDGPRLDNRKAAEEEFEANMSETPESLDDEMPDDPDGATNQLPI